MQPDPYASYLQQAKELFAQGEVVKAGQIWQAILKQQPSHDEARHHLLEVKEHLLRLQQTAAAEPMVQVPSPEQAAPEGPEAGQLLTDGCTLYDMGQTEDALHKWEQALALDPDLTLARTYAEGARRELGLKGAGHLAPPPPVVVAPLPPQPREAPTAALDQKLHQAERLLAAGHLEEAAFSFQQALGLDPGNLRALAGLEHCRKPVPAPTPAPLRVNPAPLALVSPARQEVREVEELQAVRAPAALMKAPPPPREGLNLPGPLREATERLPWLREPRILAMLAGGTAVLLIALGLLNSYRKERALRAEVQAALASALAPVARQARSVDLTESPTAIQQEADVALVTDPLRAFLRAETLVARNPSDPAAAQLLEKARLGLAAGSGGGASLAEFQQHLQSGDLETAAKVIDALLRTDPKDAELRVRAARLHLALCAAHAAQAKWDEAQDDLLRGRALAPGDRSWQARIHLLEHLRTLPKAQQASWIALLG